MKLFLNFRKYFEMYYSLMWVQFARPNIIIFVGNNVILIDDVALQP